MRGIKTRKRIIKPAITKLIRIQQDNKNMNKKIIYIDMDGVIANFKKDAERLGNPHRPDKYVDYGNLEVMPGARDALHVLNKDFDIFIASTPPWDRPSQWGAKREWLERHFPWLKRKLILTHRKDLLIGDILIDDSRWRGQPDFKGTWLWFGTAQRCKDWKSTLELIYKKHHNEKL